MSESGVSINTYENIGVNQSLGVNLFASFTLKKFWTLRGNLNVNTYNSRSNIPGFELSRRAIMTGGNLNSTFTLPKNYRIEISGFYRAPRQTLQGFVPSFQMMNLGFQKEFNKKATLGITIVQPFSEFIRFPSELQDDRFYQRSESRVPFRSFGLNFGYRFGKMDFNRPPSQRRSSIRNDDQKEGGDDGGGMRM